MSEEKDAVRMVVQNVRNFERELIKARLRAEMFSENEGDQQEYRAGWNQRALSIIDWLGGE